MSEGNARGCALPNSYKYQIHGVHGTGGQRHKYWVIYCRESCKVLLKMRKDLLAFSKCEIHERSSIK